MDDLIEIVLTAIDNLTGNKLDYGLGKLVNRLTQNVRNHKYRKVLQWLIWILLFVITVAVLTSFILLIEALKNGKV